MEPAAQLKLKIDQSLLELSSHMNVPEPCHPTPKTLEEFLTGQDTYRKLALSILVIKECMERQPYLRKPLSDLI